MWGLSVVAPSLEPHPRPALISKDASHGPHRGMTDIVNPQLLRIPDAPPMHLTMLHVAHQPTLQAPEAVGNVAPPTRPNMLQSIPQAPEVVSGVQPAPVVEVPSKTAQLRATPPVDTRPIQRTDMPKQRVRREVDGGTVTRPSWNTNEYPPWTLITPIHYKNEAS